MLARLAIAGCYVLLLLLLPALLTNTASLPLLATGANLQLCPHPLSISTVMLAG